MSNRRPLKLGIDIDGVVADFSSLGNAWLAGRLGVPRKPDDKWDWYVNYGDGPEVLAAWNAMWHEFNEEGLYADCMPVPGALPGLWLLADAGHEIVFITHRRASTAADTGYWLNKHEIEFPVHYEQDKSAVFCDLYLDDKPENVSALRDKGRNAWLFSTSQNQGVALPRVDNWLRFMDVVCEAEDRAWFNQDVALEDSLSAAH